MTQFAMKQTITILLIVLSSGLAHAQMKAYPASCYQTFEQDGSWCWFSDPRAVSYKGDYNRTYAGFVSSKGDITIKYIDHDTGIQESKVIFPELQKDDHVNPSLLFLPDGRLMIFFTKHNGGLYYTKTKKTENISEWEEVQTLNMGTMLCYSNPVMLSEENNRIYVFFRGGYNWKPSFIVSDDLGETWSEPLVITSKPGAENTNRPYTKVISDGKKRIWLALTDGHPRNEPLNSIYTMYYEGGKLYQVDGTIIGNIDQAPFDQNKLIKAYDAHKTTVKSWIWDIAINKEGFPVIVYTRMNEETDHQYFYARWNGEKWVSSHLSKGGKDFPRQKRKKEQRNPEPHYSGGITLDHNNTNVVYLSKPINDIYEIFKYETKDSGKTWTNKAITKGSKLDNVRPFVIRNTESEQDGNILWMQNHKYEHYSNYNTSILINKVNPTLSSEINKENLKKAMKNVADWQINTPLRDHPAEWTNGALYAGMAEWAKIADDESYFEWLKNIGNKTGWNYKVNQNPKRKYHADDYCVGQMYAELYRHYNDNSMIQPLQEYFNLIMDNPSKRDLEFNWDGETWPSERWSWCDALFMAPTVWAKYGNITGNKKYWKFMDKEFKATTDYLYDEEENLYFRDSNYFNKKEANGAKMFWGRGNGWVFAGLPIIINELPQNYKNRDYYVDIFKNMAKKLASIQDDKGYWHASLLDPDSYPNPETSSTAFYIYGMAWGINNGFLNKEEYLPVVEKGWKALIESIWPDGKMGWVQPIGENPKNVTAEMTEVYGVGGFLLAGSEIYKLAK